MLTKQEIIKLLFLLKVELVPLTKGERWLTKQDLLQILKDKLAEL